MGNLEQSQEINRIILRKIHEVCKKHDVRYFLDSGTLIGAVRHKSFIPWDDDADIAFMRDEYEKFMAIPKESWGDEFEVVRCKDVAPGAFLDCVTRVIYHGERVKTHCYDKAGEFLDAKYVDKIGVDCFVMDGAFRNRLLHKLHQYRVLLVYGQLMGHRGIIDYTEYGLFKRCIIYTLAKVGRMRPLDKLYDKYYKVSTSVKGNTGYVYYSNYPIELIGIRLQKTWFNDVTGVSIDEDIFDAPAEYDCVLRAQYGDYMKLPNEEQRVPQHIDIGE